MGPKERQNKINMQFKISDSGQHSDVEWSPQSFLHRVGVSVAA